MSFITTRAASVPAQVLATTERDQDTTQPPYELRVSDIEHNCIGKFEKQNGDVRVTCPSGFALIVSGRLNGANDAVVIILSIISRTKYSMTFVSTDPGFQKFHINVQRSERQTLVISLS